VLTEQPIGRQSASAHGQPDMSGLQHIPENQFPPYATISKGMCCVADLCVAQITSLLAAVNQKRCEAFHQVVQ